MTTNLDASQAVELPPIVRDDSRNRDYIPLPGGWEVQTVGNGSTLRIADTKTGKRHCMPVPDHIVELIERMAREVHAAAIAQDRAARAQAEPIDMVLHCPKCGLQHVDAADAEPAPSYLVPLDEFERLNALHPFKTPPGELPEWRKQGSYYWHEHEGQMGIFFIDPTQWHNPPHRSHLCHGCGHVWRPADVPTNGVQAVKTVGKNDSPIVVARAQAEPVAKRDREADRARFPDPSFNRWLDEAITENGEFSVWHQIGDTCDAWHGWENRPFYTAPTIPQAAEVPEAQRFANAVRDGIADFVANNWPDRKHGLAEIEAGLRAIEINAAMLAAAPTPTASAPKAEGEANASTIMTRIAAWLGALQFKPRDIPYWTNGRFDQDCYDSAEALLQFARQVTQPPSEANRTGGDVVAKSCDTCLHASKPADSAPCRSCGFWNGGEPFDKWEAKPQPKFYTGQQD